MSRPSRFLARARWLPFLLLALLPLSGAHGQDSSVQARLVIPPAETYVIGDDIPLLWEFTNRGSTPLAFLWEGCCRLNGRLTVTRADLTLDPIPPGSSLAHQFAKAETLEPGRPSHFPTRLDDWVHLRQTGRYRLQGHYTGVLPSQQPMVPKNVALWHGAASTPPLEVEVLAPDGYLAQRDSRAARRQWHLTLEGPERLHPLDDAIIQVTFRNPSDQPVSLAWPGPVDLWLLDEEGRRVGIHAVKAAGEIISLPAGATTQRSFAFNVEDLLDSPLGTYRLFLDGRDPGQVRCPSNPLRLRWELSAADVASLVQAASTGPRSGLRNKPLKRLRVHLAELSPILQSLPAAAPDPTHDMPLLAELQVAACLKPFSPHPGLVTIPLKASADRSIRIAVPDLARCLPQGDTSPTASLSTLLGIRRHLGWSLQAEIEPEAGLTLEQLFGGLIPLFPLQSQFTAPFRAELRSMNGAGGTNIVSFQTNLIPANLVLRLEPGAGGPVMGGLRKGASPAGALFQPEQIRDATFEALATAPALEAWLSDPPIEHPRLVVWAHPNLGWQDLARALPSIATRGWPFDLVLLPPDL